jgi:hypothetical protein
MIPFVNAVTIAEKAEPIMTATAMSKTLPRMINALKSLKNFFISVLLPFKFYQIAKANIFLQTAFDLFLFNYSYLKFFVNQIVLIYQITLQVLQQEL